MKLAPESGVGVSNSTAARQCAAVLVLLFLCAYFATLYPSVAGGDSGELIAAAAEHGVAHPPGYPLYTMLTAAAAALPIGTVAWRANAASALFAAIAAALLAFTVATLTGRWWAGAAAAIAFALSPVVWLYATSAEVFSLNNLLIATQLTLLALNERNPDRRLVLAAALVMGLGVANHHTSVLFTAIMLASMVWRTRDQWRTPRSLALLAAGTAVGLLPYLYLPLAAAGDAQVAWGDTGTVTGFMDHMLRRDYGTFQLAATQATPRMPTLVQLGYYARDLVDQITIAGVVLAACGLVISIRSRTTRAFALTTVAAFVAYLGSFHSLANLPLDQPLVHGVVARFWQAPNMMVVTWAGLGIATLAVPLRRAAAPVAVMAATLLGASHARAADHRGDHIVQDFAASILRAAPPNALILTRGDLITNATRYLHVVENVRPDVRVVDTELLTFKWMNDRLRRTTPDVALPGALYSVVAGYDIAEVIAANSATRPIVLCGGWKPGDVSGPQAYDLRPLGVCDEVVPKGTPLDVARWISSSEKALPAFRNDMRRIPAADSWEHVAWFDYWEAQNRRAYALLLHGIAAHDDPMALTASAAAYDTLIAAHPTPDVAYYKNLGIARARLAQRAPQNAGLALIAFRKYIADAPPADGDLPAIKQLVQQLEGSQ